MTFLYDRSSCHLVTLSGIEGHSMAEKKAKQDQDGALAWLVVTTLAPHWRSLLVAVAMLLATAALNVAPPYLVQQAIDGPIAQHDTAGLWPLAALYGGVALVMFVLQY